MLKTLNLNIKRCGHFENELKMATLDPIEKKNEEMAKKVGGQLAILWASTDVLASSTTDRTALVAAVARR